MAFYEDAVKIYTPCEVNLAPKYSRLRRAMCSNEISLGHSAEHAQIGSAHI